MLYFFSTLTGKFFVIYKLNLEIKANATLITSFISEHLWFTYVELLNIMIVYFSI